MTTHSCQLLGAALKCDARRVRQLLDELGQSVNSVMDDEGNTLLTVVLNSSHSDQLRQRKLVRYLLYRGADPLYVHPITGRDSVLCAVYQNLAPRLLRLLLEASEHALERTAEQGGMVGAERGRRGVAVGRDREEGRNDSILLRTDVFGRCALHYAVMHANMTSVTLLCDAAMKEDGGSGASTNTEKGVENKTNRESWGDKTTNRRSGDGVAISCICERMISLVDTDGYTPRLLAVAFNRQRCLEIMDNYSNSTSRMHASSTPVFHSLTSATFPAHMLTSFASTNQAIASTSGFLPLSKNSSVTKGVMKPSTLTSRVLDVRLRGKTNASISQSHSTIVAFGVLRTKSDDDKSTVTSDKSAITSNNSTVTPDKSAVEYRRVGASQETISRQNVVTSDVQSLLKAPIPSVRTSQSVTYCGVTASREMTSRSGVVNEVTTSTDDVKEVHNVMNGCPTFSSSLSKMTTYGLTCGLSSVPALPGSSIRSSPTTSLIKERRKDPTRRQKQQQRQHEQRPEQHERSKKTTELIQQQQEKQQQGQSRERQQQHHHHPHQQPRQQQHKPTVSCTSCPSIDHLMSLLSDQMSDTFRPSVRIRPLPPSVTPRQITGGRGGAKRLQDIARKMKAFSTLIGGINESSRPIRRTSARP